MSAKEIQLSVAWDFALSLKWFETVTFGKIGRVGNGGRSLPVRIRINAEQIKSPTLFYLLCHHIVTNL
jgi:hypothetical protein